MSVRALQAAAVGAAVFGGVAAVNDAGSAGIARLAISGAALAAAASFDLSERRIPNRVTIPAALALLVLWLIDRCETRSDRGRAGWSPLRCLRSD